MKKTIGIPMMNQGENSVGLTKPYLEFFKSYGQIVLLAPDAFLPDLDLLVLPGGKDIAHGNPNDFSFANSDNERFLEHFDKFTLPQYIKAEVPIYGICRGFQTLMRHFEIPLVQNIWWAHGESKDAGDSKANTLTYTKYEHFGRGKDAVTSVGSWHHQGVNLHDFSQQEEFDLIAYTRSSDNPIYNIVEFVEHKTLPIIGEQSHPERNDNYLENFLINKLLKLV